MARATNKNDLLNQSETNFTALFALIETLTPDEQSQTFDFEDRDKNIRDVLIHLYEWHQLLINWIVSNQSGEKAPLLPVSYNWKTYPKMNIEFWEKHQTTALNQAKTLLKESHRQAMVLISGFSDTELFTKQYFDWTGTTSLGSYCISSTASHYDWAIKKIKKHTKQRQKIR